MNAAKYLEEFINYELLHCVDYGCWEVDIKNCTVVQLQHLRTLTNSAILEKLEKKHGSVYKKIVGEDND